MTREQLKKEALNIIAYFKEIESEYKEPNTMIDSGNWYHISNKLADLIARQDKYIDSLIEWQDIKTAPQDGTSIMLYDGDYLDGIYEGYYYKTELGYDNAWYSSAHDRTSPKKWRPFPTPPKQG